MKANGNHVQQLVDHLFRREAGKMIGVLTRIFGVENMELAEDVVQDALLEAIDHWSYEGTPDRPDAWLYRVARNKALNILNREKYKKKYQSDSSRLLIREQTIQPEWDQVFSNNEIHDDQLRMIFTCCHPAISRDSQVALALRTLCGFSIPEIARAFLSNDETIHKKLVRARQKIRDDKIPFEVPCHEELAIRLDVVLETIYLLFNEGYSASSGEDLIRYELCEEAIRLAEIVNDHPGIKKKGECAALLSLMYLNASRFKARLDGEANLLSLAEQDRSLWDMKMVDTGLHWLAEAGKANEINQYYLLAAISAHYCIARDFDSIDWKNILILYDHLELLDHSPLVTLNKSIAVSKVYGQQKALELLKTIENNPLIESYHLFYSTRAEFFQQLGFAESALDSLRMAMKMCSLATEKEFLQGKIDRCLAAIRES